LTPTVAICVTYSYKAFLCQTGWSRHLYFWHPTPWASECPDVRNYKWRLNRSGTGMLYSCNNYGNSI